MNDNQQLRCLFEQGEGIGTACLKGYVIKGLSAQQRFSVIRADLDFAIRYFPQSFFLQQELFIIQLNENLTIKLQKNFLYAVEGLWRFVLSYDDKLIYLFSFTVGHDNHLTIGSIQGGNDDCANQWIKTTTKKLHGLRPQQLMVWLALEFSSQTGLSRVVGMANRNHPRMTFSRIVRNKKLYIADYDKIWTSYHAKPLANGNWEIPKMTLKPIEDVVSKKRSMYKKRYAMLDEISRAMKAQLIL